MNHYEKTFVRYILDKLSGHPIDIQKHEDQFSRGISDLSFAYKMVNGWIEAKILTRDREDDQPFRISIRPHQVIWNRRRHKHGGNCWLLMERRKEIWLLSIDHIDELEELTFGQVRDLCAYVGVKGKFEAEEFLTVLLGGREKDDEL
jgi:hypothetical protein